jgi:hypothetical protein
MTYSVIVYYAFKLLHVAAFTLHAVQHAMAIGTDGSQVIEACSHLHAKLP